MTTGFTLTSEELGEFYDRLDQEENKRHQRKGDRNYDYNY